MPLKNHFLTLLALPFLFSCGSAAGKFFGDKKTPHEKYANKIEDDPRRIQWLDVANNSLDHAQSISLPYRHIGVFPAGKPRALALEFSAKRGERIQFDIQKSNTTGYVIYADVFKQDGTVLTHLHAAGTNDPVFGFDAEETAVYVLRLQPELEHSGEYHLSVTVNPSLGFPVAGPKARVGSVWGDSRDNGARRHEGIDIFAPKLTPAIAAADGYISGVKEGGLGGKVVNLKVKGRDIRLYYAHLDKQLVYEGQEVKKGDTIGLVGNTGNARTTPPHLHFGIYSYEGPIDPLPFVNKAVRTAPELAKKDLNAKLQLTKPLTLKGKDPVSANTVITPLAFTAKGYIAELADGTIIEAPVKAVKILKA